LRRERESLLLDVFTVQIDKAVLCVTSENGIYIEVGKRFRERWNNMRVSSGIESYAGFGKHFRES